MEDSEDEDCDMDMDDEEPSRVSTSKRKKKTDEVSNAGTESTESSLALSVSTAATEEEETEAAAPVDDKLPQPRVSDFAQICCVSCLALLLTDILHSLSSPAKTSSNAHRRSGRRSSWRACASKVSSPRH